MMHELATCWRLKRSSLKTSQIITFSFSPKLFIAGLTIFSRKMIRNSKRLAQIELFLKFFPALSDAKQTTVVEIRSITALIESYNIASSQLQDVLSPDRQTLHTIFASFIEYSSTEQTQQFLSSRISHLFQPA